MSARTPISELRFDPTATCSPACVDAVHPLEHRACERPDDCGCRCHLPAGEAPARRPEGPNPHNPQRMLDLSEVTVGCWVSWRSDEECEREGRGGVVIDIDRVPDAGTGEMIRVFSTVKTLGGGLRWDHLREDVVGAIAPSDVATVRALWRAMAREIGKRRGAAHPEELRLGETIHLLQRSVA